MVLVSGRPLPGARGRREEDGALAVVVAASAVMLFVLAALVVDLGLARDTDRQAQNAADASALAGATALYPTASCDSGVKPCLADAVAAVKSYALENFDTTPADWASCSVDPAHPALAYVPPGESSCISFDSSSSPRQVRVYLPPRVVRTPLGSLAGVSSIPIRGFAESHLGTDVTCSLCFLGAVDAGNGDFTVNAVDGGSIGVSGDVSGGPNSHWTVTGTNGSINVAGTASGANFSPRVTKIDAFGDPLAESLSLPLPTAGLPTGRTDPCATAGAGGGPGFYTSAVELPNGTCTLQPGLYIISNTWSMKNTSLLFGTGVTLYVRQPGALDFKNGGVSITAPTTGTYANYAVVYDRDNTNSLGLQGNGSTSITGLVYAPSSLLEFNGNSCFEFSQGPVIVKGVADANGDKTCITISNARTSTITRTSAYLDR
jgi:Flp pilus assembly protein TadG